MSESNYTPLSKTRLIDLPKIPLEDLLKYLDPKPVDEQNRILEIRRHLIERGASYAR